MRLTRPIISCIVLIFCLLNACSESRAQDILLFSENFETGGGAFALNTGGPSSNSGPNQWVVNNQYNGSSNCPATPDETITTGGTIGGAPFSNYLHIQTTGSSTGNACFDQANASEQFAFISSGFCTYGLDDIHISFFWIGEGNANAFGSLWYQIDGGGWIQLGSNFNGSSIWTYEDFTDPAFGNVGNLQFGFQFENDASGTGGELSFGVDEINVVATLSTVNPIEINITSVSPNPVCEGTYVTVAYELSQALCDGTYLLELSNSNGSYPSAFTSWAINITYPTSSGSTTILLPNGAAAGTCYTFRLSRISPEPAITGTASACFEIIECPNDITTVPAAPPTVTLDPLPVCVGSVIDIPFYSTGIYAANNAYVCQLSLPDGTFSATPLVVGTSPDASTYDPTIVPLPGSVSGIIPDTEPGCNYYLRIISSNPSVIGTVWGPFCIQRCDVTTNNMQDITFCISECASDPTGQSQDIFLDVNTNGQTLTYGAGNMFTTQLFSSQGFAQIGADGILGSVASTGDTPLTITVPCLETAVAMGIPTGISYLRVIATEPSDPSNAVSTLIRINIGVESSVPLTLSSYNYADFTPTDTLCAPASIYLNFSPYDPMDGSTYMWSCSGINGGVPFESPNGPGSNVLLVTSNAPNVLNFMVQRTNYGCTSPWSPTQTVVVTGPPVVFITGATQICLGDTVAYQVPFIGNTYYSWTTDAFPTELAFQDTSNNVLNLAFSAAGSYTLSLNVLNQCGASSDDFTLNVLEPPVADAGPDADICIGESTTLQLTAAGSPQYQWASDSGNLGNGNNVSVSPSIDSDYYGTVTTNIGCTDTDTMRVIVHNPDTPVVYTDSICPGGDNAIILESDSTGTYIWSTGSTDYYTTVNDTGQYALTVEILNAICPHYVVYEIEPAQPNAPTLLSDSVCPGGSEYIVLRANMTGRYEWNSGQVNAAIYVNYPGTYILNIYANDAPCPHTQIFTITPDSCIIIPPDTIPYEELLAWVPNAFTANDDDINEVFAPVFSNIALVRDYRFVVFDRWGTIAFESHDPTEKWTGSFQKNGYYVADGVYTWLLYFRGAYEVNAKSTSGIVHITR